MTSSIDDFALICNTLDSDWEEAQSGFKKPLLPFGTAHKRYLHLAKLASLSERYSLPAYMPGKRETWQKEVVRTFEASNAYPNVQADTSDLGEAPRRWFTEINQGDFWVATCRADLNDIWELETMYGDVRRLYELLQSDEPLPELSQHDKARYLAIEALTFQKIEKFSFNVPKVVALYRALDAHARGEVVKGGFADALNALPPLPNYRDAFVRTLRLKTLASLDSEYKKAYKRFKENLQYYYGLEGGWVHQNTDPSPQHPLGTNRETDWGRRLILASIKLSILTNRCSGALEDLDTFLWICCSTFEAAGKPEGLLASRPLKVARYTQSEQKRRDKAKQQRLKEQHEKLMREKETLQSMRGRYGNSGGAPDEFDEANGACEFGNPYSYAWYTDRDSYNDVTR